MFAFNVAAHDANTRCKGKESLLGPCNLPNPPRVELQVAGSPICCLHTPSHDGGLSSSGCTSMHAWKDLAYQPHFQHAPVSMFSSAVCVVCIILNTLIDPLDLSVYSHVPQYQPAGQRMEACVPTRNFRFWYSLTTWAQKLEERLYDAAPNASVFSLC